MELVNKGKGKKGLMMKTWERCRSLGRGAKSGISSTGTNVGGGRLRKKSKSWSYMSSTIRDEADESGGGLGRGRVAPEGCFSVYVGPQKQRFVVKTECANHPLFRMLLDEAELEYGYSSEGPLELPCNVDFFYKVLVEMDSDHHDDIHQHRPYGCAFSKPHAISYRLLSPSRLVAMNHF